MSNAYEAIKAEAERLGLPKHYKDDLYKHDKESLEKKGNNEIFVWAIRKNGTHLTHLDSYLPSIQFDKPKRAGCSPESWLKSLSECHGDTIHFYFWDGKKLTPCKDYLEACEKIQPHIDRMMLSDPYENLEKLVIQNASHFISVIKFAKGIGKLDQLLTQINHLQRGQYNRVILHRDNDHSFGFMMQYETNNGIWKNGINGGLIFHNTSEEWSCHT